MPAPPTISRLLNDKGRLDFPALQAFADDSSEQSFIQSLRYPVLMGARVAAGEFSTEATLGGTAQFNVERLVPRKAAESGPLGQVVYPLFRHVPVVGTDDKAPLTIGRTHDNDIAIPDYAISRRHATIRVVNPFRALLRPVGNTNPTLVNGRDPYNQEVACRDGDAIQFGRYEFHFLSPTSLYCRLRGIELAKRIEQLIDTLGKADYEALKQYALRHNEQMFVQLVHNPSLVGAGVFRGYAVESSAVDMGATCGFLPDISKGTDATPMHLLGRSIYPLVSLRTDPDAADAEPLPFSIGRGRDNDLLMPDGSISGHHAEIIRIPDGRYFIKDLGSTNGTAINGVSLVAGEAHELRENDRLKLGRFEFGFVFPSTLFSHLAKQRR